MLTIMDVTKIRSVKNTLILETKSGVDVCFPYAKAPSYIDVESILDENELDLHIVVNVRWDDCNTK